LGIEAGLKLLVDRAASQDPARPTQIPDLLKYCPDFDADDSDLIVPLASQIYGELHNTVIPGFMHLEVNQARDVALEISTALLYDQDQSSRQDVNDFDTVFPAGEDWPLNCR